MRRREAEAAELEAVLSAVDRCPPEQQQMYCMPQRPVDRSRVVSVHRVQNRCSIGCSFSRTVKKVATGRWHVQHLTLYGASSLWFVAPQACASDVW